MTDPCEGKYDIVSRLRDHTNRDDNDIAEAAAYIERLRAERDEARRLFCEDRFNNGKHYRPVGEGLVICTSPKEIADDLGWDCYKENTND